MTRTLNPVGRLAALVLLGTLALAGCGSGSAATNGATDTRLPGNPEAAGAPAAGAPAAGGAYLDKGQAVPIVIEPQVAKTATLDLIVDDPAAAATKITTLLSAYDGMVVSENITTLVGPDGKRWAGTSTLVVSVPTANLEKAIAAAAQVGTVSAQTVNATDVTSQVVDTDSRVQTMRESVARLQALMGKAGTLAEITALETQLTQRQADLESMLSQQKNLTDKVARAPIAITLLTKPVDTPPTPTPTGFLSGLKAGWRALVDTMNALLVVLGALLPFLILLAIIAVPVWLWFRSRRTRLIARAEHPAPTPAPAPAETDSPTPDSAP